MMKNTRKNKGLPLAKAKPDEFPIYSLQSRVAARALAEQKNKEKFTLVIRFVSPNGDVTYGPTFEIK
jgi:hypothetical protein